MMIDIATEKLLTPAQAARLRPPGRGGRPTHPSTVYRWMTGGMRGVRLECIRIGGALYTSQEALQRFCERLTGSEDPPIIQPSSVARRRAHERASRALDRIGI